MTTSHNRGATSFWRPTSSAGFAMVALGAAMWGTDPLFRQGLAPDLPASVLVFVEPLPPVLLLARHVRRQGLAGPRRARLRRLRARDLPLHRGLHLRQPHHPGPAPAGPAALRRGRRPAAARGADAAALRRVPDRRAGGRLPDRVP